MRRTFALAALLLSALPCHAQTQPLPDAPKPKLEQYHLNRRAFVAGISLLAASKTADAITTRQLLDRGGLELNPIFGRSPSPAKQAGINLAFFAGESALFYLTEHNRHAWVRWAGRAFLAHSVVEHAYAVACNAGIDTHEPVSQKCRPLVF